MAKISTETKIACFKLHYFEKLSYRKISRLFEGHPNRKSVRRFSKEIESKLLRTMTHEEIRKLGVLPNILVTAY